MNNFIIAGRLTKEPELRTTKEGKSVAELNIALRNKKDDTTFLKITAFNQTADHVAKYCTKGDMLGIQGIIRNHNWTDKDNNKRYEYAFIANSVEFLSLKPKGNEEAPESEEPAPEDEPIPENYKTDYTGVEIKDTDLPF